jgi:tetratricopeptide (TPR) repeat protein
VLAAIRIDGTNTEAMGLLDEISSLETKAKASIIDKKADSIALKEKGNESMKVQSFTEAVSCYTKSIETDPTNLVSFGNRSQAYLKLSRFSDAEKDATHVLDNSDDVSLKQKSLFRRSLARRGLGGKHLVSSLADIDEAISQDKENKLFISERAKTLALYKESEASLARKNSSVAKSKSSTSSIISSKPSVVSDSDFSLKEITTTIKKKEMETHIEGETTTLTEPAVSPKKAVKKVTEKTIRKPIVIPVSDIPIPTEPPKTVYELERIWRGMKDRPDIFSNYLAIFKKINYRKCFKESVSPDLFSSLLISLRDHAPIKVITTALDGISQIPSFNMMVSLLPQQDINVLKVVIDKIADNKGADSDIVVKLKQLYKV